MADRGGRVHALLAEDVGDGVFLLDVDDDDGAFVISPRLVIGDDAEERQETHFQAEGKQAVIKQSLLGMMHVGLG